MVSGFADKGFNTNGNKRVSDRFKSSCIVEAATTLSIPKDTIPALEKNRDLGHTKHRGKKK